MRIALLACLIVFLAAPLSRGQSNPSPEDAFVSRMIEREHEVTRHLEDLHPIVETYLQVMKSQLDELVPSYDQHFVSLAEFSGGLRAVRFKPGHSEIWRDINEYSESFKPTTLEYNAGGFVAMAYPDPSTFDQKNYHFQELSEELLGDIHCRVFHVTPIASRKSGLFAGKIWVEHQNFTIVRFQGIFAGTNITRKYAHFDSWRVKTQQGLWVPAVIYSEETGMPCCGIWKLNWTKIRFKAETRFWGYDPHLSTSGEQFTKVVVEHSGDAKVASNFGDARGPVDQRRLWERQAELKVTDQLERVGLLSPAGEIEKSLQTVLNNIEASNNLTFEREVQCRVLLTSNLESAVVGHTIILSRGLLDVLPNQTTLAAVLAHNLAHVSLGDHAEANFSWADQLKFDPTVVMRKLQFTHSAQQEEEASSRAKKWMSQSPYKLSLDSIAQFSAELHSRSPHIRQLLKTSIGESLYKTLGAGYSTSSISAMKDMARIRVLPLGSRIRVDPWTGEAAFVETIGTELRAKSENTMFEFSPIFPYLQQTQDSPASEISYLGPMHN